MLSRKSLCPYPGCTYFSFHSNLSRHWWRHHRQGAQCPVTGCDFVSADPEQLHRHLFGAGAHFDIREHHVDRGARLPSRAFASLHAINAFADRARRSARPASDNDPEAHGPDVDDAISEQTDPNDAEMSEPMDDTDDVRNESSSNGDDLWGAFAAAGSSYTDDAAQDEQSLEVCNRQVMDPEKLLCAIRGDEGDAATRFELSVGRFALYARLTRVEYSMLIDLLCATNPINTSLPQKCDSLLQHIWNTARRALDVDEHSLNSGSINLAVCIRFWFSVPPLREAILQRNHDCAHPYSVILHGDVSVDDIDGWSFEIYDECWHSVRWFEAVAISRDAVWDACGRTGVPIDDVLFVHVILFHDFFKPFKHRVKQLGLFHAILAEVPACHRSNRRSPSIFPLSIFDDHADEGGVAHSIQQQLSRILRELRELRRDPLVCVMPDGSKKLIFPLYFGALADGKARNDLAGFFSIGFSGHPCVWCDINANDIRSHIMDRGFNPPCRRSETPVMRLLGQGGDEIQDSTLVRRHVERALGVPVRSVLFDFPDVRPHKALESLLLEPMHAEGSNDAQTVMRHVGYKMERIEPHFWSLWSAAIAEYRRIDGEDSIPRFSSVHEWLTNLTAVEKMATMRIGLPTLYSVFVSHLHDDQDDTAAVLWRQLVVYLRYSRLAFGHALLAEEVRELERLCVLSRRALVLIAGDEGATINPHFQLHLPHMIRYGGHPMSHHGGIGEGQCFLSRWVVSANSNNRAISKTVLYRQFIMKMVEASIDSTRAFADVVEPRAPMCNIPREVFFRILDLQLHDRILAAVPDHVLIADMTYPNCKACRWRGVLLVRSDQRCVCQFHMSLHWGIPLGVFRVPELPCLRVIARRMLLNEILYDASMEGFVIDPSEDVFVDDVDNIMRVAEVVDSVDCPGRRMLLRCA